MSEALVAKQSIFTNRKSYTNLLLFGKSLSCAIQNIYKILKYSQKIDILCKIKRFI